MTNIFFGKAKRLDPSDFAAIARDEGYETPLVRSVTVTEANGKGFDSQGRPKALFEPHRFWRELKNKRQRAKAVELGLAYENWKPNNYPKDSYPRILQAMEINREAALRATSFGIGQILGSNCELCGYKTAEEMVVAFADDEENQLRAMFKFIQSRGLKKYLLNKQFDKFAEGYNGKKYRLHGYDKKLASNYKKEKQKEQENSVGEKPSATKSKTKETIMRVGSRGPMVKALQTELSRLGYIVVVDGYFGPKTRDMVQALQADMEWAVTGEVSVEMMKKMEFASPRPTSQERIAATEEDLSKRSRIMATSNTGETVAKGVVATGAVSGVSKYIPDGTVLETVSELTTPLATIRDFIGENWGWLFVVAGLAAWIIFTKVKEYRLEDHRTGKTV